MLAQAAKAPSRKGAKHRFSGEEPYG